MKHTIMKTYILLIVIIFTSPIFAKKSNNLKASSSLIKTISKFYQKYDKKNNCWIVKSKEFNENHYCLSIIKSEIIKTKFGKRRYLVLDGRMLDKNNDAFISHLTFGMSALFIVEDKSSKLIAANPTILLGAYSTPPRDWKLVKLAPTDYWGWKTHIWDAHNGYYGAVDLIFAPYGKQGIKDIFSLTTFYSNEGVVVNKQSLIDIKTKLSIITDKNKRVYSLKLKVTGVKENKKLKTKYWIIPFNTKYWMYLTPKNWILNGYEY